jgi:MOSC domain-containing protein YiiM
MSQSQVGKVLELFISVKDAPSRIDKAEIRVDEHGVVQDKFYQKDSQRAILITSLQSYLLAQKNDIDLPYGALGENILIDYNLYHLQAGDRIQLGEALLEITQNCTLCKGLSKVDERLPDLLKEYRGIFARTIIPAEIKKGDTICVNS